MRFLVIASMRNEGPFIVEWVSWYRMLGFTDILVVTNDCTDRSCDLLGALQSAGWLTHRDVPVPPGAEVEATKLRVARADPVYAAANWVFVCDVDEFLVVHRGAGKVLDLVGGQWADYLLMAINWRCFGDGDRDRWEDGPVHRQFLWCAADNAASGRWIKTLFRRPYLWGELTPHAPSMLRRSALDGGWGEGANRWVNSAWEPLDCWAPGQRGLRQLPREATTHAFAQINHYMIRARESFALKQVQFSSGPGRDRYGEDYLHRYNRNEVLDPSALRYGPDFDRVHAEAMALPGVRRLHHLCCVDYLRALGARLGLDPEADGRLAHHLRESAG